MSVGCPLPTMPKRFAYYCFRARYFYSAVFLGLWFALGLYPVYAGEIRIAVAANFAQPLRQIAPAFEATTGHRLVIIVASSGKLFAQIRQGAPFDVFLSADSQKPQALAQLGLAPVPFTYAQGQLVVAGQLLKGLKTQGALVAALKNPAVTVAIANPKLAPYGEAAWQVLTGWGLVQGNNQPRIIYAEDVAQVAHYVATGVVDAGFIAAAQQLPVGLAVWPVALQWHTPILQQGVMLKLSPAATAFVAYLQSSAVQTQLGVMGYVAPKGL